MKEIKLTQGKIALVDDDVFNYLNQFKWQALNIKRYNNYYAVRSTNSLSKGKHSFFMHREIMKTPKGMETDHIDHNGLNNQKHNLRICTTNENQRNQKVRGSSTSQYKGVRLMRVKHPYGYYFYWGARIVMNKKIENIGNFKTETDAALAYNKRASKLFGEFANLNNVVV